MDGLPNAAEPGPGPGQPVAGWQEAAAVLAGRQEQDAGPAAVGAVLAHAAAGLLCQPAAGTTAGQVALVYVDQALAELADAGVRANPPATAEGTEVHTSQVRALLAGAATALAGWAGGETGTLLAFARAAVFTRQALDALDDG